MVVLPTQKESPTRRGHSPSCSLGIVRKSIDRKSTRLNSSHLVISYAVFCLKKKSPHAVAKRRNGTSRGFQPVSSNGGGANPRGPSRGDVCTWHLEIRRSSHTAAKKSSCFSP